MSTSNDSENPRSGDVEITDATQQIIYSWLPHSKALGASSTVTFSVRNAYLTGAWQRNTPNVITSNSPMNEEKKYDLELRNDEASGNVNNNLLYAPECRVEASIFGYGLPLQAAPFSTTYSPLLSQKNYGVNHFDLRSEEYGSKVTFDSMISLPVRWRDLTRDAFLTLKVFCDKYDPSNDGNVHNFDDQSEQKVWGTTLPLFDKHGKLRSGLHKLKLFPSIGADGGTNHQCFENYNDGIVPDETFLEGGSTSGITKLETHQDDPKWKASLILNELNRFETLTSSSGTTGAKMGGVGAENFHQSTTSSVPWLDALTRERCLDILNNDDEYTYPSTSQPPKLSPPKTDNLNKAAQRPSIHAKSSPPPTSTDPVASYLIVELPTPAIPILHDEPLYPNSTCLNATELVKFHSQYISEDEQRGLQVQISPEAIDRTSTTDTPQSLLYPLVQVLDHEPPLTDENDNIQDNPAQDKYRILAHDLIRGLVDPGLKPDRSQRARLERIIGSPSHHLSTEEKDLLWRFRFSLVDNRRALPKFLEAVDWTVESEVVQTVELLDQWRKRSPIEVTDALKLLGRNVAFQTSLVRSYAIDTLSNSSDEDLRLYLLQLVQALKYEEDVSGNDVSHAFSGNRAAGVSSLSTFLIERASRNVELANFLFSFLRVELDNPIYEVRYREVFALLQNKLSSVRVKNGLIVQSSNICDTISLWDLLTAQEKFISGIMNCQRDSLSARGKKDAKESHLREALESGGFRNIPHAVPLPSAPHIFVKGVDHNVKMFKSALYPAVVDFLVDQVKTKEGEDLKHPPPTYKVMIKTGDDLRQDQLVIMMIQLMDKLLKRGTLDLW